LEKIETLQSLYFVLNSVSTDQRESGQQLWFLFLGPFNVELPPKRRTLSCIPKSPRELAWVISLSVIPFPLSLTLKRKFLAFSFKLMLTLVASVLKFLCLPFQSGNKAKVI